MIRHWKKGRVLGAAAIVLLSVAGCGQKGPLYLPKDTPAANKPEHAAPVDKNRDKDKRNDSDAAPTPPSR